LSLRAGRSFLEALPGEGAHVVCVSPVLSPPLLMDSDSFEREHCRATTLLPGCRAGRACPPGVPCGGLAIYPLQVIMSAAGTTQRLHRPCWMVLAAFQKPGLGNQRDNRPSSRIMYCPRNREQSGKAQTNTHADTLSSLIGRAAGAAGALASSAQDTFRRSSHA
jgi:hypothetical protein